MRPTPGPEPADPPAEGVRPTSPLYPGARAEPRTCGLAGTVIRRSGNRNRRESVISNPAAVISAAGSVAV
jgi:hypothetical protein